MTMMAAPSDSHAVPVPPELVYVANAGSGPVTAYATSSRGSVSAALTVANPNNPNTAWDPRGVVAHLPGAGTR